MDRYRNPLLLCGSSGCPGTTLTLHLLHTMRWFDNSYSYVRSDGEDSGRENHLPRESHGCLIRSGVRPIIYGEKVSGRQQLRYRKNGGSS
jgi:hypothetical protein